MERKSRTTKAIIGTAAVAIVASALAFAGPRKKAAVIETQDQLPAPQHVVQQQKPLQVPKKPVVEVVFALDTTGSMGGLIQGAKEKIWSIASHIAAGQPTPELRVGLVAYRDKGDAYVTKDFDLTTDLDEVFDHLMSFKAEGGGDDPEHVSKALWDSVHKMHWSQDSMKMIFLVGDAPPHTDYDDGYDYHKIAKEAAGRGILIHSIRCGNDPSTGQVWNQIAKLSGGTYASIDQTGGVVATTTPLDGHMADLGKKLADTAIIVGDEEVRARYKAKVAEAMKAPARVAADRGAFYGRSLDTDGLAEGDMGGRGAAGVAAAPPAALPMEMRTMSEPERKAYADKKKAEREAIQKELTETAKRRDDWIRTHAPAKPATPGAAPSFDNVVNGAIEKQAASHGIKY
jgi:Mg-chelatase subunit ChlD